MLAHRAPPQAQRAAGPHTRDAGGGLPLQSLPDLLASLSTLTAVELVHKQLRGHAVPALSAMTDLERRAFEPLGPLPHPAPSLASPSTAGVPPPQRPVPSHTRLLAKAEDPAKRWSNRYACLCDKPLKEREKKQRNERVPAWRSHGGVRQGVRATLCRSQCCRQQMADGGGYCGGEVEGYPA